MKLFIDHFNTKEILFDNMKNVLAHISDYINYFNSYDNYYYCSLLYKFPTQEYIAFRNIKENNLTFAIFNNQKADSDLTITYKKYFTTCFQRLLSLEGTLYSLLFKCYVSDLYDKLHVLYLKHDDEKNNQYLLKLFISNDKFFDSLNSFIPIIYNQYGNDFWNRANNYVTELFLYYLYFHDYFTKEMYDILINKLLKFFIKNQDVDNSLVNNIHNFINNSYFPTEYAVAINNKLLLINL